MFVPGAASFALVLLGVLAVDRALHHRASSGITCAFRRCMHTDPKRDAQKTEDAGFLGVSEEAPSVANPSVANPALESIRTPPQGPVRPPTPSKQDRLDLERSSGEGMVAPESKP